MRKLIIVFISVLVNLAVNAQQTDFFWNNNAKINLEKITSRKYITIDNSINDTNTLKQLLNLPNLSVVGFSNLTLFNGLNKITNRTTEENWAILEGDSIAETVLVANDLILSESNFYYATNNERIGFSHLFYVKLKDANDLTVLQNIVQQNNLELLGSNVFMPLWHVVACNKNSAGNVLQMANLFYETDLFAYVEPDIMMENSLTCVDDEFFSNQWGLLNTGQHNIAYSGIDINACQAWGITQVNNNIIVAVVDNGIDVNHPDLTNQHPISYDSETGVANFGWRKKLSV